MTYEELRERVARAMDPLAWVEYGDRNHRAITLIHAGKAIPVIIEALAQDAEAGHADCLTPCASECDDWCLPLSDWLRDRVPEVPR